MAVSTITYYGVHFTAFIVLCCVTSIAHVSGDSDAANQSLYCNGRSCVQNEEYCDKIQNKCLLCQYTQRNYTQRNCTPHLDCLSYCIGKGIEQGMQDIQGTIPEENSPSAWAIILFILFLVLFLVSFIVNLAFAIRFHRQRQAAIPTGTGPEHVKIEAQEETPLTRVMKDNDDTDAERPHKDDRTPQTERMGENDETAVKEHEPYNGVQEQGSRSDEKQHLENFS